MKVKSVTTSNGNCDLPITTLSFICCRDKHTELVNTAFQEATAHSKFTIASLSTPSPVKSKLTVQKPGDKRLVPFSDYT